MEGHAVISHDVLASYAADATLEVDGVHALVDGARRQRGVRVAERNGSISLELHLTLAWGAVAPVVATEVQGRVAEYLTRTARLDAVTVDVVVAGVAASID
jgi:uncharacterized alkaline shock family protein YloU